MRFTVALPFCHRSSLEGRLGRELLRALEWRDDGPAEVVLGQEGEGELVACVSWPGLEGAAALLTVAFQRHKDRLDMERLHDVGRALASEQDLDKLLDLILTQARRLLSAEAGSLYLVKGEGQARELLFAHTQNAQVSLPFHRFTMPFSLSSMAGFVASTGQSLCIADVHRLPEDAPYRFNDSFDQETGYRTVSMLCVPLKDTEGEILGVLQLINRRLEGEDESREPQPFSASHLRLAESLAGQAGVAVKNAGLRQEIETLLERFVDASVLAIEQRDPVTSGHSGRVAALTVGLVEAVNQTPDGPYGELFFNERQLREVRYAGLLHDFGKVGVREQVLVKAKKLEPLRLELVLHRLRLRHEERLRQRMAQDWRGGLVFDAASWEIVERELKEETDHFVALVLQANEPSVLPQNVQEDLAHLELLTWGGTHPVMEPCDMASLRIAKGSLTEEERREIESHVTHTFRFLQQIPWTRDLASVPTIAYAHHERPDGQGYPRGLASPDIPLQSRAMAIADIFDALTAQDRPYKAAVPLARSLDILHAEAKAGHLDSELLRLFMEAKVYEPREG